MRTLMNRKAGIGVMVLLVTICFVPVLAGAYAPGDGERGKGFDGKRPHPLHLGIWRNSQIVEKLGLTGAQADQMRDLDYTHREKQQTLKAELDGLRLKMDKAFTEDDVDTTVVRQTAQKIADVKGKMFVERVETRLAVQKILTAEQIDLLKRMGMEKRGDGKRQGQKEMKNRDRAQDWDCDRFADNSAE